MRDFIEEWNKVNKLEKELSEQNGFAISYSGVSMRAMVDGNVMRIRELSGSTRKQGEVWRYDNCFLAGAAPYGTNTSHNGYLKRFSTKKLKAAIDYACSTMVHPECSKRELSLQFDCAPVKEDSADFGMAGEMIAFIPNDSEEGIAISDSLDEKTGASLRTYKSHKFAFPFELKEVFRILPTFCNHGTNCCQDTLGVEVDTKGGIFFSEAHRGKELKKQDIPKVFLANQKKIVDLEAWENTGNDETETFISQEYGKVDYKGLLVLAPESKDSGGVYCRVFESIDAEGNSIALFQPFGLYENKTLGSEVHLHNEYGLSVEWAEPKIEEFINAMILMYYPKKVRDILID
jgi:hypothetical protein